MLVWTNPVAIMARPITWPVVVGDEPASFGRVSPLTRKSLVLALGSHKKNNLEGDSMTEICV